eukprot:scaffold960_cov175-Amphora_coffeaeformis.AAC.2
MDFDKAAERLARDQKKLRGRAVNRGTAPSLSAKAKREAEMRRKQQDRMAAERQKKQKQAAAMQQYMTRCERNLGVKALSSHSPSLMLQPTSIHGDGDKIALPVSVLEFLTNTGIETSPNSPWIFRIAIPNPAYTFPASTLLQQRAAQEQANDEDDEDDGDTMEYDDDMDDEDDDTHDDNSMLEAFLDELSHKYLAFTHGSVVEFTQEEGHIGLPSTTAAALISQGGDALPTCKTVDPATTMTEKTEEVEEEMEKTPGHLAWGAFEVPNLPVEVSLVKLPKGKACTLQPTEEAILNGFYNLKDIKLVLEQSLIRTRATLSVNDLVHTWHRGVKYDLRVAEVTPATYKAVVCINTDINVDFAAPPSNREDEEKVTAEKDTGRTLGSTMNNGGQTLSGGRTLGSAPTPTAADIPTALAPMDVDLIPEPPAEQKENVCTIQIRGDGANGRRRFDIHQATLQDVFAFTRTIVSVPEFRLVARFPRRIFAPGGEDSSSTLASLGLQQGQELLMVERM